MELAAVPRVLLTVAGFDPSSGAGITADLAVFTAFGAFGVSCITAITVQSTVGVEAVEPVGMVAETIAALDADFTLAGVKIGMLATAENARALDAFLSGFCPVKHGQNVVLDPVMRSSSGRELLEPEGEAVLREKLLGRVGWITPNLDELGRLIGTEVKSAGEVPAAALRLRAMAAELGNKELRVVVTGGHLENGSADDYLLDSDGREYWVRGERIETRATHGTGCAFSSALLAGGVTRPERSAVEQVRAAKEFVRRAMETAAPLGRGNGPMNLR